MHPREWNRDVQFRGRVRVQVKQADGSFCQEKFTSRESLSLIRAELDVQRPDLRSDVTLRLMWHKLVTHKHVDSRLHVLRS